MNINVIVEIPQGSQVKYELDKKTNRITVDRFLHTAMLFPFNYGFIPETLAEDKDPVDVLVIASYPVIPGSVLPAHPIGLLEMEDEAGIDIKIIAVPEEKIDPLYGMGGELKCFENDTVPVALRCTFDTSGCTPMPGGFKIGTCYYHTGTLNGCDEPPEGLLTTEWWGDWEWKHTGWGDNSSCIANSPCEFASDCILDNVTGSDLYYCDKDDRKKACNDGGRATIECPAEIQLPFFDKYTWIISVLVIAGIYAFFVFRKPKKVL